MWNRPYTELKGFSAFLREQEDYREGELVAQYRRRDAVASAADLANEIREGGRRTAMAVKAMTEQMANM